MRLVRLTPRTACDTFARDPFLHRFFDLLDDVASPTAERAWYPPLDLVEEKDRLVAHLELPGIDPQSVQVNLQGDTLTVHGERKLEEGDPSDKVLLREQSFGTFTRSVQLPYRVQADKVKATTKHGVMSIVLPKADEYVGRQIPVEPGQ